MVYQVVPMRRSGLHVWRWPDLAGCAQRTAVSAQRTAAHSERRCCMLATAISIEVVTLIFFPHSASSEAQIRDTVSDEAHKLRLRP
jgi:hypothetical protein